MSDDGTRGLEVDVTSDSVIQRWGKKENWFRRARSRPVGLMPLPFSYGSLTAVLAALPLAVDWAGELDGDRIAVVAREEITVPAGTFLCWRLESREPRAPRSEPGGRFAAWRAWVAVNRPLVIRTEVGPVADRSETRLVSFEPAVH